MNLFRRWQSTVSKPVITGVRRVPRYTVAFDGRFLFRRNISAEDILRNLMKRTFYNDRQLKEKMPIMVEEYKRKMKELSNTSFTLREANQKALQHLFTLSLVKASPIMVKEFVAKGIDRLTTWQNLKVTKNTEKMVRYLRSNSIKFGFVSLNLGTKPDVYVKRIDRKYTYTIFCSVLNNNMVNLMKRHKKPIVPFVNRQTDDVDFTEDSMLELFKKRVSEMYYSGSKVSPVQNCAVVYITSELDEVSQVFSRNGCKVFLIQKDGYSDLEKILSNGGFNVSSSSDLRNLLTDDDIIRLSDALTSMQTIRLHENWEEFAMVLDLLYVLRSEIYEKRGELWKEEEAREELQDAQEKPQVAVEEQSSADSVPLPNIDEGLSSLDIKKPFNQKLLRRK